ncbi:MAG: type II toxin-antitoxin system death-on-curing family toxin [Actinomycetota bacterium]|nr:type II toxin-antitoxin system death-on-curing family toxin [Actinomycetota bacterium]
MIAEAVTGIDADTLVHVSRSDLLDSALHAPQAGFGDTDFYPTLIEKAAVLCVRIACNHPLPDGNKRLAWMTTVIFLDINGVTLHVAEDDAVATMLAVAAGQKSEAELTNWLRAQLDQASGTPTEP